MEIDAAIPELVSADGWQQLPIEPNSVSAELLEPVGMFTRHWKLFSSSVYAGEHESSPYQPPLKDSTLSVFMRSGVADRLGLASSFLQRGDHIVVMDAYRSFTVQKALFEFYYNELAKIQTDWPHEQLAAETIKYVAQPSTDPTCPSPHNTGASVDVVIWRVDANTQEQIEAIDIQIETTSDWNHAYFLHMKRSELLRKNGRMLNFGTEFDFGQEAAALRYYEDRTLQNVSDFEARSNRRYIYHVMAAAGFGSIGPEWWHYNDPHSQMGAKALGLRVARYGQMSLSETNRRFEKVRVYNHQAALEIAGGKWPKFRPDLPNLNKHLTVKALAARASSPVLAPNLRDTVAVIAP